MMVVLTDNASGIEQMVRIADDNAQWKHFVSIDPTATMIEMMLALPPEDKKCEVLIVWRPIP